MADTYSICGVCAVLDMHRLLAMRCRYLRIVIEAGTTYVVAARVRVGYETCVAAVELVACFWNTQYSTAAQARSDVLYLRNMHRYFMCVILL